MSLYVEVSSVHGVGLFTDKVIEEGKDICFVFNRLNNTGMFTNDFKETLYGRYTNHSDCPNTQIVIQADNILLRANKPISGGEEITANYHSLIELFNHDPSLIKLIKFW
jgi:hypothetical protein